jgi:hypothetical protein
MNSQHSFIWHQIPPLLSRVLIRPSSCRIIVDTLMVRTESWAFISLALEAHVAGAHDALADVVDAVGSVVGDFLRQITALLVMLDEVGLYAYQTESFSRAGCRLTKQCNWWNIEVIYPGPSCMRSKGMMCGSLRSYFSQSGTLTYPLASVTRSARWLQHR